MVFRIVESGYPWCSIISTWTNFFHCLWRDWIGNINPLYSRVAIWTTKGPSPLRISEFGCETTVLCSYPNVRKSYPNVRIRIWCLRMFCFSSEHSDANQSSWLKSATQDPTSTNSRRVLTYSLVLIYHKDRKYQDFSNPRCTITCKTMHPQ